jgi:pimeloyl-ACP methyl ester carboxylesterase
MATTLVFIPGLGADRRLFKYQKKNFKNSITPSWLLPKINESLSQYSRRWSSQLKLKSGCYLIGVSFGGMVALEMARWVKPKAVILIASCRDRSAVPWHLRMAGHITYWPIIAKILTRIFPSRSGRFLGAETKEQQDLLIRMLIETPDTFMRWTLHSIQCWNGVKGKEIKVYHIHGERDRLIPIRKVEPDRMVKGGGHLINLTHAKEVNVFIKEHLGRIVGNKKGRFDKRKRPL